MFVEQLIQFLLGKFNSLMSRPLISLNTSIYNKGKIVAEECDCGGRTISPKKGFLNKNRSYQMQKW